MATADIGHEHEHGVSRGLLLRWFVLAILIGVGLLLVTRVMDALRQPTFSGTAVASTGGVSVEHCMQFIAIARAAYGPNWKYRLDPRDTTCAAQVQEQWQHETNVRQPMTPLPSGTMTISQPTQPFADEPAAPTDARTRNPETYCLNVISLARTRYGSDWANRITPDEAAACGDAIRASGGR
jgi:hypothetical protein